MLNEAAKDNSSYKGDFCALYVDQGANVYYKSSADMYVLSIAWFYPLVLHSGMFRNITYQSQALPTLFS